MHELKFIAAESDSASLVLRSVNSDAEFFLPVTEDLRSFLADAATSTPPAAHSVAPASSSNPQLEAVETTEEPTEDDTPAVAPAASVAPESPSEDSHSTAPRRSRIPLSPREIQDRIRQGASAAELAEETGVDVSRIDPYSWPILQERARIAELAKTAYPVSSDGPSDLTLWEVLATALAARGENLANSEWDAYQTTSKQWIASVTWQKSVAGQTSVHVAEFQLKLESAGPSLAHPFNSIAGDLIDPRFGQPIRQVSPVTPLSSLSTADSDVAEDVPPVAAHRHPSAAHAAADRSPAEGSATEQTDEFLLHPQEHDERSRRKRKAVTPHWEDVLLGVRTNPKKKR